VSGVAIIFTKTIDGYNAFGLRIASELAFPELNKEEQSVHSKPIDAEIYICDLTDAWQQLGFQTSDYAGNNQEVYFHIQGVAIFCVQQGKRILISPLPGADEEQIRLYVLGTCMGTLLMQRKILPLHGSAVVIDGAAYAIVGESGAGKSTLAAAFLEQGYELLTDDVIAVDVQPPSTVAHVIPAYPQQKLWQESLTKLSMDCNEYRPLYQETSKFAVPVHNLFCTEQLPLAGIVELVKTNEEKPHTLQRLRNVEGLELLREHTYRQFLIPVLNLSTWHFMSTATIASTISLYRMERSTSGFTAHEMASLIIETIRKGEW